MKNIEFVISVILTVAAALLIAVFVPGDQQTGTGQGPNRAGRLR